ncbi:putative glycosylase [Tritrichomonas foetus]|uniref:Glycosylase n=1 Tax=Tritrichomonas foetus TaxID=1144522 RepID=A0A1J4KJK8_9EUKA|nr:putative glycosylase [Tritrichomonas foetus]|eukprot:OHT11505.1 putative glycosylase [Tritrichomonas foetus]
MFFILLHIAISEQKTYSHRYSFPNIYSWYTKKVAQNNDDSWALLGWERPEGVNPVISPAETSWYCPMNKEEIQWEQSDTFNPAAVVKDGKIVVMYRAEDNSAQGIGKRTSRVGYATSYDGVAFERSTSPIVYPAEDGQKDNEWPGGCEDPRVAVTDDGTYVILYTQWNRKVPRLAAAISRDLKEWVKYGPVFQNAYDGKFVNMATKSASILTRVNDEGKLVISKVNGQYFMYWGEEHVYCAYSDNLYDWKPVVNDDGSLKKLFSPRKGFFDSQLTECGPPAILTSKGIVLIYNGKNKKGDGDADYPDNAYCAGQALFDLNNPEKLITRLDKPFLAPKDDFEKSGQYPDGTVFTEGLVYYKNTWYLYYGCADSRVAVVTSKAELK